MPILVFCNQSVLFQYAEYPDFLVLVCHTRKLFSEDSPWVLDVFIISPGDNWLISQKGSFHVHLSFHWNCSHIPTFSLLLWVYLLVSKLVSLSESRGHLKPSWQILFWMNLAIWSWSSPIWPTLSKHTEWQLKTLRCIGSFYCGLIAFFFSRGVGRELL